MIIRKSPAAVRGLPRMFREPCGSPCARTSKINRHVQHALRLRYVSQGDDNLEERESNLAPRIQASANIRFLEPRGRAKQNLTPPFGLFSAQRRPPCVSAIKRDTAKPIP